MFRKIMVHRRCQALPRLCWPECLQPRCPEPAELLYRWHFFFVWKGPPKRREHTGWWRLYITFLFWWYLTLLGCLSVFSINFGWKIPTPEGTSYINPMGFSLVTKSFVGTIHPWRNLTSPYVRLFFVRGVSRIHNPYPYSLYRWWGFLHWMTFPKCLVIWGIPFRVVFVAAEMSQAIPLEDERLVHLQPSPHERKGIHDLQKKLQGIMCKMLIFRGVSVYFRF